jgi:hypothetical protein
MTVRAKRRFYMSYGPHRAQARKPSRFELFGIRRMHFRACRQDRRVAFKTSETQTFKRALPYQRMRGAALCPTRLCAR